MYLRKFLLTLAAAACCGMAFVAVAASPATTTFQVTMTIQKACTVTASGGALAFGTVAATAVNTLANTTIAVNCSKTTPYYIGLQPSAANGGTNAGAGNMISATAPGTNTDKVAYQLSSTAGPAGTVWGNTATSVAVGNGVAGTGSGNNQSYTVYGTVPSANFTPDSYVDTVTVNVNF